MLCQIFVDSVGLLFLLKLVGLYSSHAGDNYKKGTNHNLRIRQNTVNNPGASWPTVVISCL